MDAVPQSTTCPSPDPTPLAATATAIIVVVEDEQQIDSGLSMVRGRVTAVEASWRLERCHFKYTLAVCLCDGTHLTMYLLRLSMFVWGSVCVKGAEECNGLGMSME